jgi:hypothetical protein
VRAIDCQISDGAPNVARLLKPVKTLEMLDFRPLVLAAVADGLEAAAVLDVNGRILALTGAFDGVEERAIAAVITNCMRSPDVLTRMLDGELVESALDVRVIHIGIAGRCVFVVVVPSPQLRGPQRASENFRFEAERLISDARRDFSGARSPRVSSGGSSSEPAELPVVEWGVTIPRKPS